MRFQKEIKKIMLAGGISNRRSGQFGGHSVLALDEEAVAA